MRRSMVVLTLFGMIFAQQPVAFAWNSTGHRIVAYIAYKQLDDGTKQRVVAALKNHPAASTDLWTRGGINGTDTDLNLFLNAATFPDDVRFSHGPNRFHDPKFDRFHKEPNHFVDFEFKPPAKMPGDPAMGDTILNTYKANLAMVRDENVDDADQAVALSWIFHQIGDVHQPLHCVSRFAGKLTLVVNGDRGGNGVQPFPNPRGHHDLHSYWDDLLGSDSSANTPAKLQRDAEAVRTAFPAADFAAAELKGADDLKPWALDSFGLAVDKSYDPLDDDLDAGVADLPDGYDDAAKSLAKKRLAMAGYRLASQLKALFPK
jgi:hypothetical protein